jgi:hypothetical protein
MEALRLNLRPAEGCTDSANRFPPAVIKQLVDF